MEEEKKKSKKKKKKKTERETIVLGEHVLFLARWY
jgi:hypothetical protein